MQHIAQVATGHRKILDIFGANHATPDGTGVRDYIHVEDSAPGHVAAVQKLLEGCGSFTANLGTGHRHSVPEIVRAFERASGQNVPCLIAARRPGNVAAHYADASKAERLLGWRVQHDLKTCASIRGLAVEI